MERSGYADLTAVSNLAKPCDADGKPAPMYHYACKSATGFTTSAGDLARLALAQLGSEWVFWQTGVPDVLTVPADVRRVMPLLGVGAIGIVLLIFIPAWRTRRRRPEAQS
jgi:hypothetical protein